jgi:predicted enzyme related to lactoylglutathione lyase
VFDCVAVMAPTGTDASNAAAPTHWNVNFLVEDADVTIEGATSLDGKVVVPPQDTPGFRSAALADPQGAVFSVSQLTPGSRNSPGARR